MHDSKRRWQLFSSHKHNIVMKNYLTVAIRTAHCRVSLRRSKTSLSLSWENKQHPFPSPVYRFDILLVKLDFLCTRSKIKSFGDISLRHICQKENIRSSLSTRKQKPQERYRICQVKSPTLAYFSNHSITSLKKGP